MFIFHHGGDSCRGNFASYPRELKQGIYRPRVSDWLWKKIENEGEAHSVYQLKQSSLAGMARVIGLLQRPTVCVVGGGQRRYFCDPERTVLFYFLLSI